MAFTYTRTGAYNILKAYYDGGTPPASFSIFLYTAGTPGVTVTNTTGFTEAANYTRPSLSAAGGAGVTALSTFLGSANTPSNMASDEVAIEFSGTTAAIIGYLLLAGTEVIGWDTFGASPFTSGGAGDILKLTLDPFTLA